MNAKPRPPHMDKLRWSLRWLVARSLRGRPPARNPRRFRAAIVKVDRLGDAVLSLGAIRALLRHFGAAECLLIVSRPAEPLFAAEFPDVARLAVPLTLDHRQMLVDGRRERARFSEFASSEVICLRHQRGDWEELILSWLGADRTYAIDGTELGRPSRWHRTFTYGPVVSAAAAGDPERESTTCGELDRHRRLVSAVLRRAVTNSEILPALHELPADKARKQIVATPFGTSPVRNIPSTLLLASLRALRRYSSTPISLYGDLSQQAGLQRLVAAARAAGIQGIASPPPVTVVEYMRSVAAAEAVVSAETATAHLAIASDRPTLVVMGGGHYGEFGPWMKSDRQIWLSQSMDCFGCNWLCRHPEPFCLTRISETAINEAVKRLYCSH